MAQIPQERCISDHILRKQMENNPQVREKRNQIEAFTRKWTEQKKGMPDLRAVVTVPVVVHIVWNEEEENISDEQILSQIDVLNEDFRKLNDNLNMIPSEFSAIAADVEIEFCLASQDPDGLPTNGITRTETSQRNIGNRESGDGRYRIKHATLGGRNAWDTDSYINIWVGKFSEGILGYACFPGSCTKEEDGVVVDPFFFGKGGITSEPNHLGRTTTHEIGHYFDLYHLWGRNSADCSSSDFVDDTPIQFANTRGCPTHPKRSCSSNDMFMNYMDYTDDPCVAMFSEGQKQRMLLALTTSRKLLLESVGCQEPVSTKQAQLEGVVNVFPNPAQDQVNLKLEIPGKNEVDIQLFDLLGRSIYQQKTPAKTIHNIMLTNIPAGVYFLKVEADDAALTQRLIVE